jgi:adenosylmethionine-8-amino-7-oxononanoate aminotransferase
MSDFLILGTDTDAGKTTFALLWLAAFADRYEYWKPLETGASDTHTIERLVPTATTHPSVARFDEALAPLLAARRQGSTIASATTLAGCRPLPSSPGRHLLIETFGSPLSPLNESELQITFVRATALPSILVTSSSVGAIGRTLQCLESLANRGIAPCAVALLGPPDDFAVEQIKRHWPAVRVFTLQSPGTWDLEGVARGAREQLGVLQRIQSCLAPPAPIPASDLIDRDRQSVWHPYTSLLDPDPPLVSVAAQDEFLHLADGRRVIDAISSWWTILHGHRHPILMAALRQAMESFDHVYFAGVTHAPAVELAELLLNTVPWSGGRVFFSDNGSTAVEVALKMAYQFWCHQGQPQRKLFVGFENGYHGDTFGAMSVGRDPVFFGRFEPLLFRAEMVPLSAAPLDEALTRHPGQVAAVIVEPLVQGAGGMHMHTPEELRRLFAVAQTHGVLFIADEVMTGGSRTGTLWAHQAAGIAPDLICAAKTLTGGVLPLAATLAAPRVVAAFQTPDRNKTFFHGHSFTAHPLACAVAAANWKMLTAAPTSAAQRMEAFWHDALARLRGHKRVREVRIRGTIAAVELNLPGGYLSEVSRQLRRCCLEREVLLRPLGPVLYALPPLCTSPESLDRIAAAMIQAVDALG